MYVQARALRDGRVGRLLEPSEKVDGALWRK